jgi:ABC-type branched-subunit amino acid transport system ATPase component
MTGVIGTGSANGALLEVDGLVVRYKSLVAVNGLSMRVGKNAIVGLIGPNGAGKSSAINAIAGAVRPASGEVRFAGRAITALRPDQRARMGIARTFQNLELFATMTVFDNILARLEAAPEHSGSSDADRRTACQRAVDDLGLTQYSETIVSDLAYAERKLVEFARATVVEAPLLLLDEPTAGIAIEERRRLVQRISARLRERGIACLVVEHDMEVIKTMCDHVYVMDAGACIAQGTYAEVSQSAAVRTAYLGA